MSSFIDLDDNAPDPKASTRTPAGKPTDGSEELSLATVTKPAGQQSKTAKERIEQQMDEWRKTIYVVDVSGSMSDSIPDSIVSGGPKKEKEESGRDPFASPMASGIDLDDAFNDADDEDLYGNPDPLAARPVVPAPEPIVYSSSRQSKIQVARTMLQRAVTERYDKFPDSADVTLCTFHTSADLRKADNKKDLLSMVDVLSAHGGGTNITKGVERAVQHCKRAPSPVHLHNIVLVSDGLDYRATDVEENLLQQMLELGIVLDIILILSEREHLEEVGGSSENRVFKSLEHCCTRTNGRFQIVRTAQDLTDKFLEATRRLALPPAPDPK